MAKSYLPSTDAGLLSWSANLSSRVLQDYAAYGIPLQMAQDFADLQAQYALAYRKAANPGTRNRVKVAGKNNARRRLKQAAQNIVSIIRGQAELTDGQKITLGLTIRRPRRGHIGPPDHAPQVIVRSVNGHTVRLRLKDASNQECGGKPADVTGAIIMSAVGDQMPQAPEQWRLMTTTSRASVEVTFSAAHAPGTRVWLTAMWTNRRQERGPASTPVSTHLLFGTIFMRAA
jgi:hypothetical protein